MSRILFPTHSCGYYHETEVLFGSSNSGLQVGINHGSITAQLNDSFSKSLGVLPNAIITDRSVDPLKNLLVVPESEYGSYMDRNEDKCLLGTRTALLDEIAKWALSPIDDFPYSCRIFQKKQATRCDLL